MTIRIVVADQSEARFYDVTDLAGQLRPAGRLVDANAHLHDRDFKSDRPGRTFDRAPPAKGRRGAVAHHGVGGERRPRRHEAALFARQIADELERSRRKQRFDRVVLMAAPAFLGLLRAALPESLSAAVVAEVGKDLVHQGERAVREHLPEQMRNEVHHPLAR